MNLNVRYNRQEKRTRILIGSKPNWSVEMILRDVIQIIIEELVDYPGAVEVKEIKGTSLIVYEISVGEGEVGKIIGKQGRTALALRNLVSSIATKNHLRVVIEIVE